MSYWSKEDIEEMAKRNQKTIRHRKIAIGLLVVALLTALALVIISFCANEPLWASVFVLFVAVSIYCGIKQVQFLREDLSWKPRDPRGYYKADKR
jgi:hypothetical protein